MSHEAAPDWDRVQKAIDEKRLAEADKIARELIEEAKNDPNTPEVIRKAMQEGRVVMPSEVAADPDMSAMATLMALREEIDELHDSYRTALKLLSAAARTYGLSTEDSRTFNLFLPDSIGRLSPDCIDVHIEIDKEKQGIWAKVGPHDCDHVHPGISRN